MWGNHCSPRPSGVFPQQLRELFTRCYPEHHVQISGLVWYLLLPSTKQQRRALTLCTSQLKIKILHGLMQSPRFRTFKCLSVSPSSSARVHDRLSTTQPGIRLTTCRPISSGELTKHGRSQAFLEKPLGQENENRQQGGETQRLHGQADPGAHRTHVRDPRARGKAGRRHRNLAWGGAAVDLPVH